MARSIALLFVAAVTLAACGGDGERLATSGADAAGAAETPPSDGFAAGQGVLTVDQTTYEFDVWFCGFTPEENHNISVLFGLNGSGVAATGESFTVQATIVQATEAVVTHSVSLTYDASDIGDRIETPSAVDGPELRVGGKNVSYDGPFQDLNGTPLGTGRLEATCP